MTPLRQRMIRERELRQFAPRTLEVYLDAVVGLVKFHQRSPDQLKLEEVRLSLQHLLTERKLAHATCGLRAAALPRASWRRQAHSARGFSLPARHMAWRIKRYSFGNGGREPETPFVDGETLSFVNPSKRLTERQHYKASRAA